MIVLVCGSRDWTDRRPITSRLEYWWRRAEHLTVIEGGARGADRLAGQWAAHRRMAGVGWVRFSAAWKEHDPAWCLPPCSPERNYCRGAGPRRNQEMLDWMLLANEERLVLAFKEDFDWSFTRGGTEDMVMRSRAAGVHGIVVRR